MYTFSIETIYQQLIPTENFPNLESFAVSPDYALMCMSLLADYAAFPVHTSKSQGWEGSPSLRVLLADLRIIPGYKPIRQGPQSP